MANNFFLIGYHFEEFRSQVTIRKKKLISRPVLCTTSVVRSCSTFFKVTVIPQIQHILA